VNKERKVHETIKEMYELLYLGNELKCLFFLNFKHAQAAMEILDNIDVEQNKEIQKLVSDKYINSYISDSIGDLY